MLGCAEAEAEAARKIVTGELSPAVGWHQCQQKLQDRGRESSGRTACVRRLVGRLGPDRQLGNDAASRRMSGVLDMISRDQRKI